MATASLDDVSSIEIEDAMLQLHAMITASTRHLLEYIREFDRREAWRRDGATSMTHWLCGRLNVSFATAKSWIESAYGLEQLPATTEAFGSGTISYDQVKELVRFATPERDAELARQARGWSAAEVKRRAANERPIDATQMHDERYLRMRWDERFGMLRIWAQLPDTDGATVEKALSRIADQERPDPRADFEKACADALVELASMRLGSDPDVDRATIVVHVDADTLTTGGEGVGRLENGIPIAPETVRRLGCDGRVQLLVKRDGESFGVGRASRKLPAWLLRHIKERDGGCRFPGCTHYRWLHAHHIRHWASGGATDSDNPRRKLSHPSRKVREADNGGSECRSARPSRRPPSTAGSLSTPRAKASGSCGNRSSARSSRPRGAGSSRRSTSTTTRAPTRVSRARPTSGCWSTSRPAAATP
jgi:hypothetical protein